MMFDWGDASPAHPKESLVQARFYQASDHLQEPAWDGRSDSKGLPTALQLQ